MTRLTGEVLEETDVELEVDAQDEAEIEDDVTGLDGPDEKELFELLSV